MTLPNRMDHTNPHECTSSHSASHKSMYLVNPELILQSTVPFPTEHRSRSSLTPCREIVEPEIAETMKLDKPADEIFCKPKVSMERE